MGTKPLKVVCITNDQNNACGWWRTVRPLTALKEIYNYNVEFCTLDEQGNPTQNVQDAIVIIQRLIPTEPQRVISQIRKLGARVVIYELDDNTVYKGYTDFVQSCGGVPEYRLRFIEEARLRQIETMKLCDYITTTTTFLAETLYNATRTPVQVIPNYIDTDWYLSRCKPRTRSDYVIIGWGGGRRPDNDLYAMVQGWKKISNVYPHVKFAVAGWQPNIIYEELDDDVIIRVPGTSLEEWPNTMAFDIGCCAVKLSEFTMAKSTIKAMEYALSGSAVVATQAVYGSLIIHGMTGLLVSTADDWFEALSILVENDKLRAQMNLSLARDVIINHSLRANISRRNIFYQITMDSLL